MGKLGPVQEQTMEEILASIRRMISEGDPRIGEPHSLEPRLVEANRSVGNVARLFADLDDEAEVAEADEEAAASDNIVELAIAQAMEDAKTAPRPTPATVPLQPAPRATSERQP